MVTGLVVVLAFSFLFAGLNVSGTNPAVGDRDWAMFHHDLQHSGYSTSIAPNTNKTLWYYTTGSYVAYSSPAVVDGKVYIGSLETLDGKVYCLDAASGAFIWSYTTGGAVWSSPA